MASHTFNLVDEKWIPCIMPNGDHDEFGLLNVLVHARKIGEIFDPSPLITISLHRLLLAILHRNFGPENSKKWSELWKRGEGRWDQMILEEYFEEWNREKKRFDLFDHEHPFYQSATLPLSCRDPKTGKVHSYQKPIANLVHELASGDNATLFDHTTEVSPKAISPAEAARMLVAFQSFAVGGLLTLEKGQDPKRYKSADNAPLVKGAVTLVRGSNLFETLMLNFHRYNLPGGEPFDTEGEDVPAWERNEETMAEDRRLTGYLDLLTYQSRRVRLHPEEDPEGQIIVKQVVIMKGNQFPDRYYRCGKETMIAFRKNEKAKPNEDPWPAVAFQEDKSLWRDSLTLFQSLKDKRARPKMLDWLNDLASDEIIPWSATYHLSVFGLSTSKAKITLWRHEHMPLPLKYLAEEDLVGDLKYALNKSEEAGNTLKSALWHFAASFLSTEKGKAERGTIENFVKHLGADSLYWSRLETPFYSLLPDLPQDRDRALETWVEKLRHTARDAFKEATRDLDQSARTLKAMVEAERILNVGLAKALKG